MFDVFRRRNDLLAPLSVSHKIVIRRSFLFNIANQDKKLYTIIDKNMSLTKQEIEHIATLARLRLSGEELEKYGEQISSILDYVDKLQAVDTTGVEPTSQVTDLTNITRDDEVIDSEIADGLIAQAPASDLGFIRVPKILDK